jgi:hypothetical protein
MFETMFFLCPAMSRPLDSATPGKPPKVPFSGVKGMFSCFYVKKIVPVDTLSTERHIHRIMDILASLGRELQLTP